MVDMGGSLAVQLLITVLTPASYVSSNLLALLCCATLIPITLTKVKQPEVPRGPRLRPMLAFRRSLLAAAGVVVAALSLASFRMVGPIYSHEVGLAVDQIAYFLAALVLSVDLAQYTTGWLADNFGHRWVLIWLSVAAIDSYLVAIFVFSSS